MEINQKTKDTQDIHEFIKERKHLVWSTRNYEGLSEEVIVEAVLNYGNWDDVQKLIQILGIQKTATIFRSQAQQRRCNYHRKTKNYFQLYFNRHANGV